MMRDVPESTKIGPLETTAATKHKHTLKLRSGEEWYCQSRKSRFIIERLRWPIVRPDHDGSRSTRQACAHRQRIRTGVQDLGGSKIARVVHTHKVKTPGRI